MSAKEFALPIIVNGRLLYPHELPAEEVLTLRYESGAQLSIPRFTREHLAEMRREAAEIDAELAEIPVRDVISFLGRVGDRWDRRDLEGRMIVRRHAHQVTKFSELILESDYSTIGHFLAQRFHLYDQIESEFGDQRIFDEWIPVQMGYRRAFPRGLALHYLVGNLPLASCYSLIRSMVSKNRTIAKLPSRDPVTPIGLAMAVIEVDPAHPVSRSLSLAYWPRDDEVGLECMIEADTACVWGGDAALAAVKRAISPGVPLAEYGPKWSASVIDLDQVAAQDAAMRVVDDAYFYDQEACFNTQRVFVKGNVQDFLPALQESCERFVKNVPYLSHNADIMAHRSMTLREAMFMGYQVLQGDDWGIVVLPLDSPLRHPLARTIFVHQVDDVADVAKCLDRRNSQTLSVYPWSLTHEHRDAWARAGADRIVELGWSKQPREGFTHDGTLGMQSLVRLVSVDRPWTDMGRYYSLRPNLPEHFFIERFSHMQKVLDNDNLADQPQENQR